jgi:hypothetical protein
MFKKLKASEFIRRHLNGTGSGFDLDDLVSLGRADLEDVAQEVVAISSRYRTPEYPVGISNPDADAELRAVAERLEVEGR